MPDKALVVESDPTTQKQIAGLLTRRGFWVECVDSGDRAIGRFVATLPKLVVCAEQLPGLSGLQVCQQLRRLGSRARILLLFNLPLDSAQRDELCADVRCDGVICRPFRVGDLADALIAWGLGEEAATQDIDFGVPIDVPLPGETPRFETPRAVVPPPTPTPLSANQTSVPQSVEPILLTTPKAKAVLLTKPKDPPAFPAPPPEPPQLVAEPPQLVGIGPLPPRVDISLLTSGQRAQELAPSTLDIPIPFPLPTKAGAEEATSTVQGDPSEQTAEELLPIAVPERQAPIAVSVVPQGSPKELPPDAAAPEIATAIIDDATATVQSGEGVKAPSLLPLGVPRFGDLASMPLPRLLYELYVGTYFGVLRLRRRGAVRIIYFWAGVPVRVDTDQLTDSLGAVLKARGQITEEQLQTAKQHALTQGCAIGIALVETGALHERDLLDALVEQNAQKLTSTFAWRDGMYEARDDTTFSSHTVLCDINPLQIIWRGVCEHYEVAPLLEFFSRQRERFVVATDLFGLQAEMLTEPLEHLIAARVLDGESTVESALLADAGHTVEIARALYVLLVTDMIRMSPQPGKPAPVVVKQEPDNTLLIDYAVLLDASERIAREYLRIKGKDHFAILGVPPKATTEDIETAHRQALERLEADRNLAGLPPEDHKRLREITRTLTHAFATLADPSRRQLYARTLNPSPVVPLPQKEHSSATQDRRSSLFIAEAAYLEGQKLLEANKPYAARQFFLDAIETHPQESTYRVAVAQAILAGGHAETENPSAVAFSYIDEALRLDPANLIANIEAAKLLAADGAIEQAHIYLDRVLKRAPEHPLAQRLLREIKNFH